MHINKSKKQYLIFVLGMHLSLLSSLNSHSQNEAGFGGGGYTPEKVECISEKQTANIIAELKAAGKMLEEKGLMPEINVHSTLQFIWPVQLISQVKDPSYFGISNYVDNNAAFPNQLLDYNCGTRTYDLSGGYNHRGVDIFSWPLAQRRQEQNSIEIIAAAPGTILNKYDGQPDKNCGFCINCTWNAIYILHANGSVAWYGHLKNGSITSKPVGSTVQEGEYLGIMGSSGSSTTPHLHFEVWANQTYTQLIDPFGGPCNGFNGNTSWWKNQRPYRRTALNKIMTGSAPFVQGICPTLETPNEANVFAPGATIFLTNFFQDQVVNMETRFRLLQPDGSVWQSWNHLSPSTYNASWWWWSWKLPNETNGYWTYEVTLPSTGQVVEHTFYVGIAPPITTTKPGNFDDPSIWSSGTVPGNNDSIFVCHPVTLSTDRNIFSLMVNEGGQVIVPDNRSFRVGNTTFKQMHQRMVD